ncbi:MAG TPA: translation initiation factor Sui1 [Gemmatimonadales bacterium]|nr:translation initiation factor Sui1 [Gemmatimonadales bacterium]
MKGRSGLVYSTELGRMCRECRQPLSACRCREPVAPASDGIVRVLRETKGRKGAGVSVVTGLPLTAAELASLATKLKKRCGSGGTVKEGRIEIQGDHRDLLVTELGKLGYTVKRVGG